MYKQQNFWLTVLEAGKSETKASLEAAHHKVCLAASKMEPPAVFSQGGTEKIK